MRRANVLSLREYEINTAAIKPPTNIEVALPELTATRKKQEKGYGTCNRIGTSSFFICI